MKRVAVIGGGIGGLSLAFELNERANTVGGGLEVVLLESGSRLGGNIATDREDGWIIERGPNGFLDNVPATLDLVNRLGLEARMVRASEHAAKRFIYRNNAMRKVPTGPIGLLTSSMLTVPGRLRVMWEPFAKPKPKDKDETVHAFASRRIGREAASVMVDAMVSGVFAGDSRSLSLASAFPKMADMEDRYGGLVRAMIAKQRERKKDLGGVDAKNRAGPAGPGGTLTSFDGGMSVLVETLAEKLGSVVRMNAKPVALERSDDARPWTVRLESGEAVAVDVIACTIPASPAAKLFHTLDDGLAGILEEFLSAPLAVVALGFSVEDLGGAPDGFGVLIPRGEGPRILGCLWDSTVFPNRAGEGRVLVRAMIGGALDTEAVKLSDAELLSIVKSDLANVMNLKAVPVLERVYRHSMGIGQYNVGHGEHIHTLESKLQGFPGLLVSGSSFYGVAMNTVIEHAGLDADRIVKQLS